VKLRLQQPRNKCTIYTIRRMRYRLV
jgi:hypothetical protein